MKEIQMSLTQWVQSLNPPQPKTTRKFKKRGTSRLPPKGMIHVHLSSKDEEGMDSFLEQGVPRAAAEGKSWYGIQVIRVVLDSKGEVVRKNKQVTSVFTTSEHAAGMGLRRCTDPWPGQEPKPEMKVAVWKLGSDQDL
jgi:hypothetical protein